MSHTPSPCPTPRTTAPPERIGFAEPWRYELNLPRDPRVPAIARTTLRAVLRSHGLDELLERAELLVSELITNAVCHTTGPASLALRWTHPALRISVQDTDPNPSAARAPAPTLDARRDALDGRGLLLLDALADRWGRHVISSSSPSDPGTPPGKSVWCELSLPTPAATA
ncbi:ATP-binding protein [Streptomyces sp. ST2-7A]|uniref:ATP-binding protein n=1 Tax=Streptomyces sp. ST2-7A TaxID=2907214 RepID=UPI001F27D06C|nr:ATP-binding protein [Streptomyces sp. ST2-7A]MCE7083027.1 ATP-binding protein [Streptomyces sp. ST2-7A]